MAFQTQRSNAIQILNLPKGSRQVDMAILVAKTHIRPFLSDYWLDTESNIGHLLLRKQDYLSFVLFVLQKHFCQADEIPCYFVPELVEEEERSCAQSQGQFSQDMEGSDQPRLTIFESRDGDQVTLVIILV